MKIIHNINTMIRDVFHNPPSFTSVITPSWKPMAKKNKEKRAAAAAAARALPLAKEPKLGEMKLYQPPSGKYSARGGRFSKFNAVRNFNAWKTANRFDEI